MASAGRINKEIATICKPDSSGVIAQIAPDDQQKPGWRHLIGTITGPEGTAYEGGGEFVRSMLRSILWPRLYIIIFDPSDTLIWLTTHVACPVFDVDIQIPKEYPFEPPKMR